MALKIVVVTGTPGTGKTKIAKKLSLLLNYAYFDGSKMAKTAYTGYDHRRRTHVVDISLFTKEALKVRDLALKQGNKGIILDSHLAHFLPKRAVTACIVLTCSLPVLYKRLRERKYSASKIRENLDAEIFDTVLVEASEKGHKIIIFDTSEASESSVKRLASGISKL